MVVPLLADESRTRTAASAIRAECPFRYGPLGFLCDGKPHELHSRISARGPGHSAAREVLHFTFGVNDNGIEEDCCRGALEVDGHAISWNLRYRSTFRVDLEQIKAGSASRAPHIPTHVFSGADHLRLAEFCRRSPGIRSSGTQLRIPASQFLDAGRTPIFPHGQPAEHVGGAGLRDAVRLRLPQSRAMARMECSTYSAICGTPTQRWKPMQWNFRCAARNGMQLEVGDRRPRSERASSPLSKDQLLRHLRSVQQQPCVGVSLSSSQRANQVDRTGDEHRRGAGDRGLDYSSV